MSGAATGRALVTGGAGFIGSHLVEALVAGGRAVRVLDDFSSGREENLAAVRDRVEIVRGDCADPDTVAAALQDVDLVFHEAAIPSVQRSVEDPLRTHRANVESTLVLLDAARRGSVKRLVFAASSSAYGDIAESPKRESLRPEPLSPYAAGKVAAEQYLRAFSACYGLHTVALRYFNVFGPRQDPSSPYSGVISLFIKAAVAGSAPTIHGDGEQTRDFVFVEDVVRANLAAATRDVPPGAVFNVAGGRSVTINELFRVVRDAVGGSAGALEPRHGPARPGDVRHSLADIALARRWLGFEPRVSLEDGIRATVSSFQKESKP